MLKIGSCPYCVRTVFVPYRTVPCSYRTVLYRFHTVFRFLYRTVFCTDRNLPRSRPLPYLFLSNG